MKGVILAAGYGTRFLPVTRTVPKELLPIVDRPCLDLVVEEMIEAGVTDLLIVTSRRKRTLDDWFDRDPELEAAVAHDADKHQRTLPPDVAVQFVRQAQMGGTGDAILHARTFAGDDPILVAFPDDLFGRPNATAQVLRTFQQTGHAVLAAVDHPGEDVSRYGVIDAVPDGDHLRVRGIVEKPAPGTEPSTLVSVGRYLYTPELLDLLAASAKDHRSGELYPIAAMSELASRGRLSACAIHAPHWDTGSPLGYLEAVVDHALADPVRGPSFEAMMRARLAARTS